MSEAVACPACGKSQTQTGWGEELCPGCLLRLALLSPVEQDAAESPTWTRGEEAPTPASGFGARDSGIEPGKVLGERYQIRGFLGRGGMGEVWRAYDLKLRVEVALKALRSTLATDAIRLDLLRQEVRAAREVTSPNVCRIYDLVELDGAELVSMEYVDGTTLLEVMRESSRMDPPEAQEMASQFLAGLEAIHEAGLVHRDVKPENIMVTRTGRVVLMDMGIARSPEEGAGSVAGTPAYMAPEQAKGKPDARSDLFSAGVILAEMVSPDGVRDFESRQSVWTGIRQEPVRVPETPWSSVVKKAVDKDPDRRFQSAHELTRALEEVAFRVHDESELEPYPGLSSFDESDAEYFFGREAEIEAVWKKLQSAQLLGLIGASGSGKSSFIGAGLIPARPEGWSIVRCTPEGAAVDSLRRAAIPEIEDDPEAVRALAAGGDAAIAEAYGVWRQGHEQVLLVVDQFEELFTQNTEEEQSRVAELLGSIALEADVHVLLSMRDDFLMRCHEHGPLLPMFSELTGLRPPVGGALRRAVVQPALRCGYRFEDEALADEILAEVEGERGALPLLAFGLARLWDKRDRDNGLITRQAYQDIGGVGGALAQHAEGLMEQLGRERVPDVREIFRNLVTAQGTRAARDVDELLSVFRGKTDRTIPGDKPLGYEGFSHDVGQGFTPRQSDAEEVLRALIDARLLTSYEVSSEDDHERQRVEIIHESLMSAWPRLVGWRTQDADAARLRDELRHAANQWDEHGRTDDRLWTGGTFKEFEVWRERYPGGLTEVEREFAEAMTALANRRRRRRQIAATVVVVIAVGVGAVTTTLWRQSVAETQRAEAGKLLVVAQAQVEDDPTAALAYARAALSLADTPEARRFAVEVLWNGPVARILPVDRMANAAGLPDDPSDVRSFTFSPDGSRLAMVGGNNRRVLLFPEDGGLPQALPRQPDGNARVLEFSPRGDVLVTGGTGESLRFWSWPDLEEVRTGELGGLRSEGDMHDSGLLTYTWSEEEGRDLLTRVWPLVDGEPEILGDAVSTLNAPWRIDAGVTRVVDRRGRTIFVSPLRPSDGAEEQILGEARDAVRDLNFSPDGELVASLDESGEIRVWSTVPGEPGPLHVFQGPGRLDARKTYFDPAGRYVTQVGPHASFLLWDLLGSPGCEARVMRRLIPSSGFRHGFHPQSRWVVTSFEKGMIEFWPLDTPWAWSLPIIDASVWSMAFSADSRQLAMCPIGQPVHLVPLSASDGNRRDVVPPTPCLSLAMQGRGEEILVGTTRGDVLLYPVAGREPRRLPGGFARRAMASVALDLDGRRAVAVPYAGGRGISDPAQRVIRVWDLESGEEQVHSVAHLTDDTWNGGVDPCFTRDGLYVPLGGGGRLMRLTLPTDPREEITAETILEAGAVNCFVSPDGRFLLANTSDTAAMHGFRSDRLLLYDLEEGTSHPITSHGTRLFLRGSRIDPTGRILVTGAIDGVVRVGPITGGEPHLLLGHRGLISSLAISPDGEWIASADDESVRIWPTPDVTNPPLHTLPHDELLAKLDSFTNLRAVRDENSSTGWALDVGPFPGWETVPTW